MKRNNKLATDENGLTPVIGMLLVLGSLTLAIMLLYVGMLYFGLAFVCMTVSFILVQTEYYTLTSIPSFAAVIFIFAHFWTLVVV